MHYGLMDLRCADIQDETVTTEKHEGQVSIDSIQFDVAHALSMSDKVMTITKKTSLISPQLYKLVTTNKLIGEEGIVITLFKDNSENVVITLKNVRFRSCSSNTDEDVFTLSYQAIGYQYETERGSCSYGYDYNKSTEFNVGR